MRFIGSLASGTFLPSKKARRGSASASPGESNRQRGYQRIRHGRGEFSRGRFHFQFENFMPRTAGRRSSRRNQWRRFEVSGVSGATGDRRPTLFYVRNHLGYDDHYALRHHRRTALIAGDVVMTTILADRTLLDLIEQLEGTRALLEAPDADADERAHFPILTDNALRAAIRYLVQLREDQHAKGR
jgi:hypothetical protein